MNGSISNAQFMPPGKMFNPTDCILIMGRRGCGKTHLSKRIQEIYPRRVIIDTLSEYKDQGQVVNSFTEFTNAIFDLKKENKKEFVLIYQFPLESPMNEAEFNQIMRICYYFGNIQIVLEEIQNHCSTQWLPHWLKNNLLVGRHQGLSLLFTSQRPGEVNKTIVSQCHHIFCGTLTDKNDINYVAGFLNQNSEKLSGLPDRRFIYFNSKNTTEISNDF